VNLCRLGIGFGWQVTRTKAGKGEAGRQAYGKFTEARGRIRETKVHKKHMSEDACEAGIVGEPWGGDLSTFIQKCCTSLPSINHEHSMNPPLIASPLSFWCFSSLLLVAFPKPLAPGVPPTHPGIKMADLDWVATSCSHLPISLFLHFFTPGRSNLSILLKFRNLRHSNC
jgi:hypothetical protein